MLSAKNLDLVARVVALGVSCLGSSILVQADTPWIVTARDGMVAADHPEASQIGAAVLKRGGNAFDAAVATSLALTVCRPESTGLGGGGFALLYVAAAKQFVVLDFRETAPGCATVERYAELAAKQGDGWSASVYGGNAVAVPGLIAGLAEINGRFGSRPWAEVCRPATELAERGFLVDDHYRDACAAVVSDFEKWPALKAQCAALSAEIMPSGVTPAEGERLRRPRLAEALRRIATDGPAVVYGGPVGEAVVEAVKAAGGGMTLDDLRGYRVRERMPLRTRIRVGGGEYEIVTVPPPSSGGTALIEALNVLSQFAEDAGAGFEGSEFYAPLLIVSLKHAFADRARWLGDPDFSVIPFPRLISRDYAAKLTYRRTPERNEDYGSMDLAGGPAGEVPPDDGGTSHFCIADRFGNIVSMTETINGTFGSYVVAEPYGIVLNNEIDDLTTVAGQPNLYGLTQSAANLVGPGKRPLSSMTPTIVLRVEGAGESRPFLALGGSGGPRIISNVLQVARNVMVGQPLAEAMIEPRLHHQWQPDEIYLDRAPPNERWRTIVKGLERVGHKISPRRRGASIQAILFADDGALTGACDPKKGGRPAAP